MPEHTVYFIIPLKVLIMEVELFNQECDVYHVGLESINHRFKSVYDTREFLINKEYPVELVDKAIERKTGARGLRAILEETMRDIMFEIPTNKNIVECIITKETVLNGEEPKIVLNEVKRVAAPKTKTKKASVKKSESA